MSPDGRDDGTQIGTTLRDARRRMGLEVREVEDRTKIRARYLRALENEDWDTLPAPAYIRGFLRTYGQVLGLDGEMLADEFRRRHGEGTAPSGPSPSEPLLSERRRPTDRRPSRGLLIGGVIAAIVLLLVVLGTFGSGEDEPGVQVPPDGKSTKAKGSGSKSKGKNKGGDGNGSGPAPLKKENATLLTKTGIDVCLIAGSDKALIDGQVLPANTEEQFKDESKRYRLDLRTPGAVRFHVGKENRRLEVDAPASFEADSRGIREIDYKGPSCP